ncbi:MAG TPA: hypothetical protein VJB34_09640 [Bdellovibrionota bacterium]|nr:MAG: hypothetical protein A2Z91_07490 [Deltaproteobacteria bacterium GWA2_38_16]OGQ60070.1 MAG: hypothetical protein A3G92_07405 [Deltaproteobacteria bacterium RIFCSPLOWO2_12_FULL_38_8]HLD75144.1 hypothetical protein [Bdellovibrionota bacterium]
MNKNIFILFFVILSAIGTKNLYAQDSIFDEGVDTTIRAEDIGDDVRMWAQNTALKLKKLLKEVKKGTFLEKRVLILQTIQESVEEAKDRRELLLMRFTLNRALKLEEEFNNQHDALVVHHILLPAVKQAISLYEQSDLPYLQFNSGKPEAEIEPPNYAAYTKTNIGYLLNASNMNKTLEGQFNIAKISLAWVAKDILRSPKAKRNSANADIVIQLQKLLTELEPIQKCNINYKLNNKLRNTLLDLLEKIVPETSSEHIVPPLCYLTPKDLVVDLEKELEKILDLTTYINSISERDGILRQWYYQHQPQITIPTISTLCCYLNSSEIKNELIRDWFDIKYQSLNLKQLLNLCEQSNYHSTRDYMIKKYFNAKYETLSTEETKTLAAWSNSYELKDYILSKKVQLNMSQNK